MLFMLSMFSSQVSDISLFLLPQKGKTWVWCVWNMMNGTKGVIGTLRNIIYLNREVGDTKPNSVQKGHPFEISQIERTLTKLDQSLFLLPHGGDFLFFSDFSHVLCVFGIGCISSWILFLTYFSYFLFFSRRSVLFLCLIGCCG